MGLRFTVAAKMTRRHLRGRTAVGPRMSSTLVVSCQQPLLASASAEPSTRFRAQQQQRQISQHTQSKRQMKRQKKKQDDPFKALGLSSTKSVDYGQVKKAFLQIAMAHHPDTSAAETEEEREAHREIFVAARKAFENIVQGPDGVAVLREDEEAGWDEEELNEWFQQESGGFDMPFMDAKTRKEVSRVMDEIGGGLDRDGGMWTLARMVANDAKNGGDGASLLRLEAGNVRSREINGVLRRRRKR